MDDNERRRLDAFIRIRQFGVDYAEDFPAGSVGATQFAEIDGVIGEVEAQAGDQTAGHGKSRQDTVTKDTARENLRESLYEISRTARSMEYQFNGISANFRMPRSQSDQNVLATGRAFYDESLAYDADFQGYGLDSGFRAALLAEVEAFEDSIDPTGTATGEHVAATAEIGEAIRRGMIARRILDGVVKNTYRSSVGNLAAWLSASHIERQRVKNN